MIKPAKKEDCCGCTACAQRCPKGCITLQADSEGFSYPFVDTNLCNNCGICEKVCPVINQKQSHKPVKVLAAINNNEEIRLKSSSGGIFSLLAEQTLKAGGVVFGAAFNKNWEAEHIYVENAEELERLRGSKYVQSNINNSYKEAERFLKDGREVLFSGTPCQIAALKLFLRKEYRNLTTIDVVCHGAPSPKVWNMYLKEITSKLLKDMPDEKIQSVPPIGGTSKSCIEAISFRSKITGWKKFSFQLKLNFSNYDGKNTAVFAEGLHKNSYMQAFLSDLILRPSCYACPAKDGKSDSDITLADLWGSHEICPELDDDQGLSLILIKNEEKTLPKFYYKEINYCDALKHNPSIEKSVAEPQKRTKFFKLVDKYGVTKTTEKCLHKSRICILWEKILWNIKNRILK